MWSVKTNQGLEKIIDSEDIVRFVKSQCLRWLGYVKQIPKERMSYEVLHEEMDGIRKRLRPNKM